jgi:hypothetical protein
MDVDHPPWRQLEERRLEDVTVRDDDPQVGLVWTQHLHECRIVRVLGLEDRDGLAEGDLLDRRRDELRARPSLGTIGLRHHGNDVEPFSGETTQRRNGELRGAEEEEAHVSRRPPPAPAS